MRKLRLLALGSGLILAALIPIGSAQGSAQTIHCGDVITQDTKLESDLTDCPGNGIVIGADNIRLDLNGHTIDGDGVLGCPDFYTCDFGIDNTAGHDGVTIEGGSIREFATAIFVLSGADNRIRAVSSSHNILGGLLLIDSNGSRIDRNSISENGLTTDQAGLIVFDSRDVGIDRNSIVANGDIGMFLIGLNDSRVTGDSVSDNPEAGVIVEGSRNELSRNRFFDNGDNVVVAGDDNIISRNEAGNASVGFGIVIDGGDRNLVKANDVDGAAQEGIRVTAFDPSVTGLAEDNLIRANEVDDTQLDGILVDETASGSLVERNVVSDAGDDGIDVEASATTLTRNLATRNADLGIEAVPGVIDGGGNRAFDNGNPAQCLGITCT
jgi:parallel beta-helix repeat protein